MGTNHASSINSQEKGKLVITSKARVNMYRFKVKKKLYAKDIYLYTE
jgi:hypothetical protein